MVDCHGLIDNGEISVTSDKVANEEATQLIMSLWMDLHYVTGCFSVIG